MKRPDEERQLFVKLTDHEVQLKGEKLSAVVKKLEDIEVRKKAAARKLKDEQEDASLAATSLATEIETKREVRPVQCFWSMDTDTWRLIRKDTGEIVDEQPVTMADRQSEMFS